MKIRILTALVATLLFSCLRLQAAAQETAQTGDVASKIVERVLKDAGDNKKEKAGWKYWELSVVEEYEPDGKLRWREAKSNFSI